MRDDRRMTTTETMASQSTGSELPDPNLRPPVVAESADPFSALRVVHLLARLPRGEATSLADVVVRLNAEYSDWSFSRRVVADVIAQLRANWITDYRTVEGIQLDDGTAGPTLTIDDSARTGPWLVEQAWRLAAECHAALDEFARGEGRATEG